MSVRLPVNWDGIIPDPGVPFEEWLATGTVKGIAHVSFDKSLGTAVTLVWDSVKDSETGINLDVSGATLFSLGEGAFSLVTMIRPAGAYFRVHPDADEFDIVEGALTSVHGTAAAVWEFPINGDPAGTLLSGGSGSGGSGYLTATGWDFSAQQLVSAVLTHAIAGTSTVSLWATPAVGAAYELLSVDSVGDTIVHNALITEDAHLEVVVTAIGGNITAGELVVTVPRTHGSSPISIKIPAVASGFTGTFVVASNGDLYASASGSIDVVEAGSGGVDPGAILYQWREYEDGHQDEAGFEVPGILVAAYKNDQGAGIPDQSTYTDSNGLAELWLPADTYYLFRYKSGRNFVNPVTIEVS